MNTIQSVLSEQKPGFIGVSYKRKAKWHDEFLSSVEQIPRWLADKGDCDVYFCVTTLKAQKRIKQNVTFSRYLWQDLDEVDPRNLDLRPTIAWLTSPGRYQALWRLDRFYSPGKIEQINKMLARRVGADQGSWILTKVLRFPGFKNYKYPNTPQGELLWDNGPTYSLSDITKNPLIEKYKSRLSQKIIDLLEISPDSVEIGTRSETLWFLELALIEKGIPKADVLSLIRESAWNKFAGRADEETRLHKELQKAYEHVKSKGRVEKVPKKDATSPKICLTQLVIEKDTDLMTDIALYPGWLVEGWWTRQSHGIVAGEPKSFKSTLALDLMVSIASGKPFLGQFEVVEKGPVLLVQNENASWIIKDRLTKIRASKGLIGKVERINDTRFNVTFPPELPIHYVNQQGFNFSNEEHRLLLEQAILEIKPKLLVLDPLYLLFDGDINSAKELNPILGWLLQLKEKYNLSLMMIHHWRKQTKIAARGGQRMLGSTTLHGWVESAWYISVEESSSEVCEYDDGVERPELCTPVASSHLVIEREFRGAGVYPKVQVAVAMGEFDSPDYSVKMDIHRSIESRRGVQIDPQAIEGDIKAYLSMQKNGAGIKRMSEALGYSRSAISKALSPLIDTQQIYKKKRGLYAVF